MIKPVGLCLSILALCACGSLPESGTTEAKLYADRCGACHKAPRPFDFQYFQWERLITMMDRRVLHQQMQPALSAYERDTILAYLKKHARTKVDVSGNKKIITNDPEDSPDTIR